MPFKRKYRKKGRKRVGGPRKRVGVRKSGRKMSRPTMRSMPTSFPDRIRVKLVYSARVIDSVGTIGVISTYLFAGNSVYDPDVTSTGHQPYAYDQWSAMYRSSRVAGSSINVQVLSAATSSVVQNQQIAVIPHPDYTSLAGIGWEELNEQPYAKSMVFNQFKGKTKMSHYMSTRKIYGVTKGQYNQDGFESVGSDPSKQWLWGVYWNSTNPSSTTATTTLIFKLTYYVEFWGRKNVGLS